MMGHPEVGKTSLITKMLGGPFDPFMQSTIGASFFILKRYINDRYVTLNIWDTAGEERYDNLIPMYTRNTKIVIICSDGPEMEKINKYIQISNEEAPGCKIALVMTKIDNEEDISFPVIDKFAKDNDYELFYTSSLTGKGVTELINYLMIKCSEYTEQDEIVELTDSIKRSNRCSC